MQFRTTCATELERPGLEEVCTLWVHLVTSMMPDMDCILEVWTYYCNTEIQQLGWGTPACFTCSKKHSRHARLLHAPEEIPLHRRHIHTFEPLNDDVLDLDLDNNCQTPSDIAAMVRDKNKSYAGISFGYCWWTGPYNTCRQLRPLQHLYM